MKAFVLAGGLGTRLQPRFGSLPKPLAPIGGRPFVTRQLEWLAAHGVSRAVMLAGHGAESMRETLGTRAGGVDLEWSVEPEPMGTGGALALAHAFVDGPALVVNGDTLARFVEKDEGWSGPAWVNGGAYAFAPALWRHLPEGPSSLERDVLPRLAARGLLRGFRCAGRFWDIGTPEDWERAERELAR